MKAGLLLLSGGSGTRMGAPKHALPHPGGGSWGGHLVGVFAAVFPDGPVQVLGDPLPDHPDLPRLEDPREGPAVALRTWARLEATAVDLPDGFRPLLAASTERSLYALATRLPHLALPSDGAEWVDVDTPADRQAWERESP